MPYVILRDHRIIAAPVDVVFDCVADPERYCQCQPSVANLQLLTPDRTCGVGTRFRETRKYHSHRTTTIELECTSYVKNQHVRFVRDAKRDVWDYLVRVERHGEDGASTFMVFESRAYSLLSKVVTFLFGSSIRNELKDDMDNIKTHCEAEMEERRQKQRGHIAWNYGDDMTTLHTIPMRLSAKVGDRSTGSIRSTSSTGTGAALVQNAVRPGAKATGRSLFTPAAA